MKNKVKDYSRVRGLLTDSVIQLDFIKQSINESCEVYSEIDYWQASLELLRNCLYGTDTEYQGQLDILEAIKEIRQEITNSLKVVKKFDIKIIKYLDIVWNNCKKAEGLLL